MLKPRFPDETQHIAIAGRNGSGKTIAALDMLSRRNMDDMAWIIIDHKRDDEVKKLPAQPLPVRPVFLPNKGLYVVRPKFGGQDKDDLENLIERIFKHGKIGIYVDEGHLMGHSDAIRNILVAGRSKRVPLMWVSQRANWIDTFIWSQCRFYRVFALQSAPDIKTFNANFPIKWSDPAEFHSWYYDGTQGKVFYLAPSSPMSETLDRLEGKLLKSYKAI